MAYATIAGALGRIAEGAGARPSPTPPLPPKRDPDRYEFSQAFFSAYGLRLHYFDTAPGSPDPVVFLHGNPSWSYLWRKVVRLLEGVRCVALDLPGMGRSDKPPAPLRWLEQMRYVEAFLDGLITAGGARRIVLVAHDWGTACAFQYVSQYPAAVAGVAFMEALLRPFPSWEEFPRRGAPPALGQVFRSFRGDAGKAVLADSPDNWWQMMLAPVAGAPLSAKALDFYREPFASRESRLQIWQWANELPVAGDPPDTAEAVTAYGEALAESATQKLLIYGPGGVITTAAEADWVAARWPRNLTVQRIAEHSSVPVHFFPESYPEEVAAALRPWLARVLA